MAKLQRISIFVMHNEDPTDFNWVKTWIKKWKLAGKLRVEDYSTGGWEHYWDIEVSEAAIAEVPESYLCASEWATPEISKTKK